MKRARASQIPYRETSPGNRGGVPIGSAIFGVLLIGFVMLGQCSKDDPELERRYQERRKNDAIKTVEKIQKGLPVSESEKKSLEGFVNGEATK
jgi:hypothetical protein